MIIKTKKKGCPTNKLKAGILGVNSVAGVGDQLGSCLVESVGCVQAIICSCGLQLLNDWLGCWFLIRSDIGIETPA